MNHQNTTPHHEAGTPSGAEPKPAVPKVPTLLSSLLVFLVVPVLIALFLTAFVIQSYQVDGQSMETTLQNHDRLLVDKLPRTIARIRHRNYVPNRGDIVIFNQSGLPDSFYQKQLIKRVIGLPGERVVVKNGQITVYNADNPNGFNPDAAGKYHAVMPTTNDISLTLAANEIFVCGDNRPYSEDSRYFGPVNVQNLIGKLVVRILPLNNTKVF
jgi:signal peptidase I